MASPRFLMDSITEICGKEQMENNSAPPFGQRTFTRLTKNYTLRFNDRVAGEPEGAKRPPRMKSKPQKWLNTAIFSILSSSKCIGQTPKSPGGTFWRDRSEPAHQLAEVEGQLAAVENDDHAADLVDDGQYLLVEFGAEKGDQRGDAQKPRDGGGSEAADEKGVGAFR